MGYSGWVYEKENLDCFKNMPGLSETVNISWIAELINEININTSSLEFTIFSVPVINHSIFLPIYSSHPPPWWEDTSKLWMNSRGAGEDILEQKEAGDSFLELSRQYLLRPCHIWKSLDSFLKHLSQWGIHQDGNFPWSSVWWSQQTDAGLRSDLQADIFTVHRGPMLTEKMKMQGRKNKIGFLVVGLIWWTFSSWFICFILYLFMCLCVLFWWVLFLFPFPPIQIQKHEHHSLPAACGRGMNQNFILFPLILSNQEYCFQSHAAQN